jgi:hypothetical protein
VEKDYPPSRYPAQAGERVESFLALVHIGCALPPRIGFHAASSDRRFA